MTSGGGGGGAGGALTGVVDSGVSNASSESELLMEREVEEYKVRQGPGPLRSASPSDHFPTPKTQGTHGVRLAAQLNCRRTDAMKVISQHASQSESHYHQLFAQMT